MSIAKSLADRGFDVTVHDPLALENAQNVLRDVVTYEADLASAVDGANLVIVTTLDDAYAGLPAMAKFMSQNASVLDVWRRFAQTDMTENDVTLVSLGLGEKKGQYRCRKCAGVVIWNWPLHACWSPVAPVFSANTLLRSFLNAELSLSHLAVLTTPCGPRTGQVAICGYQLVNCCARGGLSGRNKFQSSLSSQSVSAESADGMQHSGNGRQFRRLQTCQHRLRMSIPTSCKARSTKKMCCPCPCTRVSAITASQNWLCILVVLHFGSSRH